MMSSGCEMSLTIDPPPVLPPSTDDETRHPTNHVGHMGMGSFAPATPSDSRRTLVNGADQVFSSDASYPLQANRS
jgi:hypothetical protein